MIVAIRKRIYKHPIFCIKDEALSAFTAHILLVSNVTIIIRKRIYTQHIKEEDFIARMQLFTCNMTTTIRKRIYKRRIFHMK